MEQLLLHAPSTNGWGQNGHALIEGNIVPRMNLDKLTRANEADLPFDTKEGQACTPVRAPSIPGVALQYTSTKNDLGSSHGNRMGKTP